MVRKTRGLVYDVFGKEKMSEIIKKDNQIILERWPFLEAAKSGYIHGTWLDGIPDGWRFSFGEVLCNEINESIEKQDDIPEDEKYHILQVKEKYGELRWYDCNSPEKINDVIKMYEYASRAVCSDCGKLKVACLNDRGYICPICKECYDENIEKHRNWYIEHYKKEPTCMSYDDCVELEYEDFIKVTSYTKDGKHEISYDLRPTYEKMQEYINRYEYWVNSFDRNKRAAAEELMKNCILFLHAQEIMKTF